MIVRIILLFIVVAMLLWVIRRMFGKNSFTGEIEQNDSPASEDMRQCKFCGIHVPESSIIILNDKPYCCQEHADSDQQ
jgi:uncharacterized protein